MSSLGGGSNETVSVTIRLEIPKDAVKTAEGRKQSAMDFARRAYSVLNEMSAAPNDT